MRLFNRSPKKDDLITIKVRSLTGIDTPPVTVSSPDEILLHDNKGREIVRLSFEKGCWVFEMLSPHVFLPVPELEAWLKKLKKGEGDIDVTGNDEFGI